jgi:hypothetical protein
MRVENPCDWVYLQPERVMTSLLEVFLLSKWQREFQNSSLITVEILSPDPSVFFPSLELL